MTKRDPIGKIISPFDRVKHFESPLPGTLWAVASYVSRWVHPDSVITTLPDS